MKKTIMIVSLSMLMAFNVTANENASKEKIFHIVANSSFDGIVKDSVFFYFGKVIVRPDNYEIKFIDYDIKPDTPIEFKKKDKDIRYRNNIFHKTLHLKTYGEIFAFEKEEFSEKLGRVLSIKDGVINVNIKGAFVHFEREGDAELYDVSFYDENTFIHGSGRPANKFEKRNFSFKEGLMRVFNYYLIITPEFGQQLEKEKRFYIGGCEDIKDHIIWK